VADFSLDADDFEALVNQAVGTQEAPPEPPQDEGPVVANWQLESIADAYADTEPTRFLVDGLLPIPSLSIVFGGPGSLKSMLLADLAVCIANGLPWLEPTPDTTVAPGVTFHANQAPVIWIDFDNGRRRTRERMGAIGRGHNMPATNENLRYVSMPTPWLDASDTAIVRSLAALVRKHSFKLVVIDNLGLISGDIDENSGEMAQVMGLLRWLSEDTECAVIVVHHQRKSNGSLSAGDIPKGETLRGHTSIAASLDLALLIERKGREDAVAIIPTKVRDYQDFDTFGALWTFEHQDGTKRMERARFFSRSVATGEEAYNRAIVETAKGELRKARSKMQVKDLIDLTRDTMAAKPGGKAPGISKVRGLLREAAERGEMFQEGSTKSKVYWL
jgi:hypothetical protein